MKTLESSEDYNRDTAITALRFDGHYNIQRWHSISISACATAFAAPVTTGTPWSPPCTPAWVPSDPERMSGALCRFRCDLERQCDRHDAQYLVYRGQRARRLPCRPVVVAAGVEKRRRRSPTTFSNTPTCSGSGITFWAINPHALDDPMAYWKSLYPDTTTQASPGITWAVWHEGAVELSAGRFQRRSRQHARTAVTWVLRLIHTNLDITQHLTGLRANTAPSPPMPAPRSPSAATTTSCRRSTSR